MLLHGLQAPFPNDNICLGGNPLSLGMLRRNFVAQLLAF